MIVWIGVMPAATAVFLALTVQAAENVRSWVAPLGPKTSQWLLFGDPFLESGWPVNQEAESDSLSIERLADLLRNPIPFVPPEVPDVIPIRRVIVGRELAHSWTDGAGVLILNLSKPAVTSPPSTRFVFDGIQQAATTKTDLYWAALSSQVTMSDPDEMLHPGRPRDWQTDESVRMAVAGPLFVFGQFGASTPSVDEQQLPRWQGRYGVGVKIKPWIVDEVQVRGGPTVRSDDTGRPLRGPTGERTELFLEAATKLGLPVVGPLNLEYMNTATPSPTHHERNLFNQEFRLARPLTGGGQVHVGARYRPDDAHIVESWVERMQVFMGFELKR